MIRGKANQSTSVNRVSEGADQYLKMLRDGTMTQAGWFQALALEGRVFVANIGSVTTPITFGATATIDITKPAAWITVPSSVAILPIYIAAYMEVYGTSAQFEINAVIGTGGSRTSGGTAVTPANYRADNPIASACSAFAGNSTPVFVGSTTNLNEFWRDGAQFTITKTAGSATAAAGDQYKYVWTLKDAVVAPVGVGACQLAVNQGSQAGQGFITIVYAELPVSAAN